MPLLSDSVRHLAAAMIVAALVIATLIIGRTVLIPLAGAVIISFVLAPVVRRMAGWGLPRGLSVTGVVAIVLFLLATASALLSVELVSIASRMNDYRDNIVTKVRTVSSIGHDDGMLKRAAQTVDNLTKAISSELSNRTPEGKVPGSESSPIVVSTADNRTGTLDHLAALAEPVARLALLVLFTIFLLLQHQDMRDRIVRIAGTDNLSETTSAMSEAGKRLSRLFLTQALMSAGYGVLIGTTLWIAGLPGAIVWGVLAGMMRFVPFIGSYIAAIPPVILAAGVDPGWWLAIFTFTLFVVSELVMGNVVEPLVLGRRVGLSPFAMIAAASFWTLVWGPVGLLLAAPLTMTLVVLGRHIQGLSFVSVLLGDEPALQPEQELYHRLLSCDALAAADQIGTAIEETSLAQATDHLVLPALALAAHDALAGRLSDQQLQTISTTLAEASELHHKLALLPDRDEESALIIVVPARGSIDITATSFLARVIEADTHQFTRAIERATGLTALSLGGMSEDESPPTFIVIASVADLPRRQLQLIAARAARSFPGTRVIVLTSETDADSETLPGHLETTETSLDIRHISTVVELLGNLQANSSDPTPSRTADNPADLTPTSAD